MKCYNLAAVLLLASWSCLLAQGAPSDNQVPVDAATEGGSKTPGSDPPPSVDPVEADAINNPQEEPRSDPSVADEVPAEGPPPAVVVVAEVPVGDGMTESRVVAVEVPVRDLQQTAPSRRVRQSGAPSTASENEQIAADEQREGGSLPAAAAAAADPAQKRDLEGSSSAYLGAGFGYLPYSGGYYHRHDYLAPGVGGVGYKISYGIPGHSYVYKSAVYNPYHYGKGLYNYPLYPAYY